MVRKPASYVDFCRKGGINEVLEILFRRMGACDLCPRKCRVNRLEGETGICKTGRKALVSSYGPHFGEESCLSGSRGSGTIFFTHCNLRCTFCQNYEISHLGHGKVVSDGELAEIMLYLQEQGCHNINFVSPSHVIPQVVSAIKIAAGRGLCIPLVYNTGGYDEACSVRLLDGIIDIYMPDLKFSGTDAAGEYCDAGDYFEKASQALGEMHRQTGVLRTDSRGIAVKGVLVRHLVMPGGMAGTMEIMNYIAAEISPDTYVNIMDQYHPRGDIRPGSAAGRRISHLEFLQALGAARKAGLHNFL